MIPRVHIYFITLHNKCLYNYSYPASTAHFNVNPTKKKKSALQKSVKAACWFWISTVLLGSPVLHSPAEVRFPSVFAWEKPCGVTHLCRRGSLERQPAPFKYFVASWSKRDDVFDLDRWILSSPAFHSLWWKNTHIRACTHTHARLSDLKKFLFFLFF